MSVMCNKCGQPMVYGIKCRLRGHMDTALSSNIEYSFLLCDKCLLLLMNEFMVPVEKVELTEQEIAVGDI